MRRLFAFLQAALCAALLLCACTVEDVQDPAMEELRQSERFADVDADSPFCDAVCFTVYRGYLTAGEDGNFAPDALADRREAVLALYRMSGADRDPGSEDEAASAEEWAGMRDIVLEGEASLDERLTRGQLALFLSRYVRRGGSEKEAIRWAMGKGYFSTMVYLTLGTDVPMSRGQLAQVLTAFAARSGDDLAAQAVLPEATGSAKAPADHDGIQSAVEAIAQRYGAAAVQAAVVEQGRVTDVYAWGWAVQGETPLTAENKFRVAALSVPAAALAAMALAEEGAVDLDAPLGECWGLSFHNPSAPYADVTLRSILSQTSTIAEGEDVSVAGMRAWLEKGGFTDGVPGDMASWRRGDYPLDVLGTSLELAAGETVNDVLERRFFDIMDIDAAFGPGALEDPSLLADIYREDGSAGLSAEDQRAQTAGGPGENGAYFAGGLAISAGDYAKLTALLAGGGRYEGLQLLAEGSVELMESLQGTPAGEDFQQALPMEYRTDLYGREALYCCSGGGFGAYDFVSYDPAAGDGVVVLTSGARGDIDGHGVYAVCGEIAAYIYRVIA